MESAGSCKSPDLKPELRKWSNLPRNISTRMGVCRVGAVGRASLSLRNWIILGISGTRRETESGRTTAAKRNEGESNEDVA